MTYKKIVVETFGMIPLNCKGGIMGPILTPFLEDIETIRHLVATRFLVKEVLEDGTKVPLTLYNYDKDNSGFMKPKKPAPVRTQEPKKEEVVKEKVDEVEKPRNDFKNKNNFNNNNRQKNFNNNSNQ